MTLILVKHSSVSFLTTMYAFLVLFAEIPSSISLVCCSIQSFFADSNTFFTFIGNSVLLHLFFSIETFLFCLFSRRMHLENLWSSTLFCASFSCPGLSLPPHWYPPWKNLLSFLVLKKQQRCKSSCQFSLILAQNFFVLVFLDRISPVSPLLGHDHYRYQVSWRP